MAKGIAHREWYVYREDYESEADFRAAVEQEQALNVHIQERLGVGIVSAPIRRRGPGGTWFTDAYVFQTASVPGIREPEPVVEDVVDEAEPFDEDRDLEHVEA